MESPVAERDDTRAGEELRSHERKALLELRSLLEEAIAANRLLLPQCRHHHDHHRSHRTRVANSCSVDLCPADPAPAGDASLWGVPLLPSKGHEGTDLLLFKFLRAREFKAPDALEMLRRTLSWRRKFGIDGILDEDLESDGYDEINTAIYMDYGGDREGHPLCYNYYRVFRDRELYERVFGDEEKRERFLRWRVQLMERSIKRLSFKPGGVGSMVQITDLDNSFGPDMKELRSTANRIISLFQDNYPEFVAKNVFVNVSLRYYSYHALFSSFFTQRSRSKFIFARPAKVTESLLKFIAPEKIPIQYGGFKREDDDEFSEENGKVSEMVVRGGCLGTIEIPIVEPGVTVVWDVAVVGLDVNYTEEFIPDDEGSYRVLIQKENKMEESPARGSFYINEPGRIVLSVDNRTYKKKRVLYRTKSKLTIPLYDLINKNYYPVV